MNALVIVDVQNDFCPGGRVAGARGRCGRAGDQPHPAAVRSGRGHAGLAPGQPRQLRRQSSRAAGPAIGSSWPACRRCSGRCIACKRRRGRSCIRASIASRIARVFRKGTIRLDSYSGFFDNGRRASTGLDKYLRERGVTAVYVCGLATDYCVKHTALDAVSLGLETHLIVEACRGVDLQPGDTARAIAEMRAHGVAVG